MLNLITGEYEKETTLRFAPEDNAEEYITILEKGVDETGGECLVLRNDEGDLTACMDVEYLETLIKALNVAKEW